jgi:ribosome biogenesis ATPase
MSLIKVTHHIKKFLETSPVGAVNEVSVQLVLGYLLQTYKEYLFEPREKLLATIESVLKTIVATQSSGISQPTIVSSLNQQMQSQYNKSASKRQRPVESEPSSFEGVTNEEPAVSTINVDDAVLLPIDSKVVAAAGVKRRKPTPKSDSAVNLMSPIMTSSSNNFLTTRPKTRLTDLAGIDSILQQIKELVFYPIQFPALYAHLGVSPPCGILLHGPSGCGKTMLASAIAGELGMPFFKVTNVLSLLNLTWRVQFPSI